MGTLNLDYRIDTRAEGDTLLTISKEDLASFNPELLRLGPISKEGEYTEALAAVFDLQGFTDFCSQNDPHLVVPEFLDSFLKWLFAALVEEVSLGDGENEGEAYAWAPVPFFAKFLGDGVLFLWNMRYVKFPEDLGNVIVALNNICAKYSSQFLFKARSEFVRLPDTLRCGVARGRVVSIGGGADYVGPCINMASRLQKLGNLTFAVARRGLSPERCFGTNSANKFIARKVAIRGVGDELILILKEEFDALPGSEQEELRGP